ncbi:Tellurium resistance [Streptomyces sp. S186]|uniref:Tellurium resistance n=1 Tax=Streptomyces sp. S186 TaxID=3434395 RepID=UPI003F665D67
MGKVSFLENLWRGNAPKFDGGGASYVVELTKRNPVVSLTKQGAANGHLRVNLSWQMRTSDFGERGGQRPVSLLRNPGRLFRPEIVQAQGPAVVNVDLDLACLYELQDGSKGVVQPLGDFLGDLNGPPFVKLSGDDRFGSGSGETLYVNLDHRDGPRVEVKLDERAPQARSCAVFMLENGKDGLSVRREVKYVYGFQAELDRLYGWGLQWGRGYKSKV